MDFVAVDVETANPDQSSICAIGIVAFNDGQIVSERHTYVDPEDEFSPHHTGLHGIAAHHVIGAPTVPEILEEIGAAHAGTTIVHHGSFDRTAFQRAFRKHGCEPWSCRWLNTVMVARRTWLEHHGAGGYSLAFLCDHLGIALDRHHDPLEDARAAGHILLMASADTGLDLEGWHGRVLTPIGRPRAPIDRTRPDASPAAQILAEMVADEVIVFTGRLSVERREVERMAHEAGFRVGDNVTRETTVLVVGDQDVRRLAGKKASSKQIKAEGLVAQGASIRIVTEADFRDLIAPMMS